MVVDITNGNNDLITLFDTTNNPNLLNISVDDTLFVTNNWNSGAFSFDAWTNFI